MFSTLVRLMRPHQWVKNGFVLIGLIFAQSKDLHTLIQAAAIFAAFCLVASAVYVFNDLIDAPADRVHPTKKNRPIASGAVTPNVAIGLSALLCAVALGLATLVSVEGLQIIAAYAGMNILYSVRLKHIVIIDVFVISAGFMLRILAGTVGLGIPPSDWLLLTAMMLTLFLGFSKRRAEILTLERNGSERNGQTRKVIEDYSATVLDQMTGITAACTIMSYGLYTVSNSTIAMHQTKYLFYTIPFVIYGIFRYLFLLHMRARGADTAKDMFADRHLLFSGLSWLATTFVILNFS